MYAKSLIGIEVTGTYDRKFYGYIYSKDDLSGIDLSKVGLFLLGQVESEISTGGVAYYTVFTQNNARMLFNLIMSEPLVIRQYNKEELDSLLSQPHSSVDL